MKKLFQIIGVLTLFTVSFSYHDEVAKVGKITDSLLNEVENNAFNYRIEKVEATVNGNTIIPGINGKTVDINKSYSSMKQIGFFNENNLVYKINKVENNLAENTDKYIINGNLTKKEIALVFKVDLNDDIDNIVKILNNNDTPATFFINTSFAQQRSKDMKKIMLQGHTIGNLSDDNDYIWLKTLIMSMTNQKNNYCIVTSENFDRLYFCDKYNDYTIKVNNIIDDFPLIETKNNLTNGKILYFEINDKLINELSNINNYIISKGYRLVSLETLLKE